LVWNSATEYATDVMSFA